MAGLPIYDALYPDLVSAGGLAPAFQQSLDRMGATLNVIGLGKSEFSVYVRVDLGTRSAHLTVAIHERLFLFDLWRDGVWFGTGLTPDLGEVAFIAKRWVQESCSVNDIEQMPLVRLTEGAKVFDEGREVEARWNSFLTGKYRDNEYSEFISLASQQPALRMLFPYTSHITVCFSRCTGYPYSNDCPHVTPIGQGQFEVRMSGFDGLGVGDAAFAVNLVLKLLSPNSGPAKRGTANSPKDA
ncbi:MAG: DUF6193 family natural product biosynthesis protein [Planctomycetota bacterium]